MEEWDWSQTGAEDQAAGDVSSSNTSIAKITVNSSTGGDLVTFTWPASGGHSVDLSVPGDAIDATDCDACSGGPIPVEPVTVSPPLSVSVSCTPQNLAFGPTAPTSTTTGSCSATVSQSGGSYSWTANTDTVALVNSTTASPSFKATNPSSSQGDTTITLTYTVSELHATGQSSSITVHKPTSLKLDSDTTNPTGTTCQVTCLNGAAGCTYQSYLRTRIYDVLDQFGNLFTSAGISSINAQESFSGVTSTCGASPPTLGTAQSSQFHDNFSFCANDCQPGGPGCTASGNQTITVNGITVRTPSVTWNCTNCTVNP